MSAWLLSPYINLDGTEDFIWLNMLKKYSNKLNETRIFLKNMYFAIAMPSPSDCLTYNIGWTVVSLHQGIPCVYIPKMEYNLLLIGADSNMTNNSNN